MEDLPQVWERMPAEPERAYEAFREYLALPPPLRDARNVQLALQRRRRQLSLEAIQTWMVRWNWNARAQAWDKQALTLKMVTWREREERLREEAWKAAETLIKKAAEAAEALDPRKLSPLEISRIFEAGFRIGMAALPLSKIEPDEMREILRLLPPDTRIRVVRMIDAERKGESEGWEQSDQGSPPGNPS